MKKAKNASTENILIEYCSAVLNLAASVAWLRGIAKVLKRIVSLSFYIIYRHLLKEKTFNFNNLCIISI